MAAHTRLNVPEFEKCCRLRDLHTDEAIGRFLGVRGVTVGRILRGDRGVGGDFIAATVLAFRPYGIGFGDLFIPENDDSDDEALDADDAA